MTAPTATDLTCVDIVDRTFGDVFAQIEGWRTPVERVLTGSPGVAALDDVVETLVVPELTREGALIIGAGFVARPGLLVDAPWHLAWWLGHANTFGITGPAKPELRRLVAIEDEDAESFRDYTTLEWWRVPATRDVPHITGPYVDYLCTDDYTLTLTVPAHVAGAFAGVVGADLYVNDIERVLLPAVRPAGSAASIINAAGRVVVSTDHATGSLLRIPDLPARAASPEDGPGPDGLRVVPCRTPNLILVTH